MAHVDAVAADCCAHPWLCKQMEEINRRFEHPLHTKRVLPHVQMAAGHKDHVTWPFVTYATFRFALVVLLRAGSGDVVGGCHAVRIQRHRFTGQQKGVGDERHGTEY